MGNYGLQISRRGTLSPKLAMGTIALYSLGWFKYFSPCSYIYGYMYQLKILHAIVYAMK